MSYVERYKLFQECEGLAKQGTLTINHILSSPLITTIVRQPSFYIHLFLVSKTQEIVNFAIGENPAATQNEVLMAFNILFFSSRKYSKFFFNNKAAFDYIISKVFLNKNPNVFFKNGIRILTKMINYTTGKILSDVSNPHYFLSQVLVANNSMFLDDLLSAIFENSNSSLPWMLQIDVVNIIENALSSQEYSFVHYRVIRFLLFLIKSFSNDPLVITPLLTPRLGGFLINIGFSSLSSEALSAFRMIFQKNDEKSAFMDIVFQNMENFIGLFKNSSFFNRIQYEAILILKIFIDIAPEDIPIFYEIALFLQNQSLVQITNSFLHNAFYIYFIAIAKFNSNFQEHLVNSRLLYILPDLFSQKDKIHASFWGHLIMIADIIQARVRSLEIVAPKEWYSFIRSSVVPFTQRVESIKNNTSSEFTCYSCDYQKNIFRHALNTGLIDNNIIGQPTSKDEFHEDVEYEYDYEYEYSCEEKGEEKDGEEGEETVLVEEEKAVEEEEEEEEEGEEEMRY